MSSTAAVLLQGQPYMNFINSCKSKQTKIQYRKMLVHFTTYYKIPTLEDLLALTVKDIEQMITNYITNMNARQLSYHYINLVLSALFHFFDMNDIILNKKKIKKFTGEYKKANKDRAYTHDEIKQLVDTGDFRFKALVLFLSSTGIRLGSTPSLQIRHLEKKDILYRVTVYENSSEEYFVFTTPEAAQAIDHYLDFRRRAGESIRPDSPLFRNEFNMNSIATVRKNSRAVTIETFKNILHSRLRKIGLIEKSEIKDRQRRHEVPLSHGFRKFWMTQAVNSKLNPEIREMLLGHKIGIASSYYRPTQDEMQLEFEKAVDALTIEPSMRLQRKIQKLEIEKTEIQGLALELDRIKKAVGIQ